MRPLIVVVGCLFAASLGLGCGAASIPLPPGNAKAGPPPGASGDMSKAPKNAKK